MFLLVPAHPGSPGQRAIKQLLLLRMDGVLCFIFQILCDCSLAAKLIDLLSVYKGSIFIYCRCIRVAFFLKLDGFLTSFY